VLWLNSENRSATFTVRQTDRGFELFHLSKTSNRPTFIQVFARLEDALSRWNELEDVRFLEDIAEC
jgi:hypothetical protein